jgi:Zn-dependent protease with chaperone function
MEQRKLTGLNPQAFEHPLDRAALAALKHTAGFDKLIGKFNEWGLERTLRVQLTGSYLKVTEDNFPEIFRSLSDACEILDMSARPDMYIASDPGINAFTAGTKRPIVVVTTGAVDALGSEELLFIIGHELGHILCGHSLYYQVAEYLPLLGRMIGAATFGFGQLMSVGLQAALMHWKRMSELSCDRAGLLACQNADAAINTMIKLAGLPEKYYSKVNTEDFISQAKSFREMDDDTLSRLAKYVIALGSTHPWTVARASQFLEWYDTGEYEKVLENPKMKTVQLPLGVKRLCTSCQYPLAGTETFCPGCGIKLAQDVHSEP